MSFLRSSLRVMVLLFALGASSHASPQVAFTLFEPVRNRPGIAFAPVALADTLSLLYFGSAGETETAFQARLFPTLSRMDARTQAAQRSRAFRGYESSLGLFIDLRLSLADDFKQAATEDWGFEISRAPLQTNPVDSAEIINAWFAHETRSQGEVVVTPSDIPGGTALVGVTVATFISPWKQPYFQVHDTRPELFYFGPNSKALVQMMKGEGRFLYSENEQFQIVRLDYSSEEMALLLLLPKKAPLFHAALAAFDADALTQAMASLKPVSLQLSLPKIRYESKIDWHEPLARLGLFNAFTPRADFGRIQGTPATPLFLSRLVQEVRIRWNERGTEARATTVVSAGFGVSAPRPPPPLTFIANHPFAYLIFQPTTLDIFFMGVVSEHSQMPLDNL